MFSSFVFHAQVALQQCLLLIYYMKSLTSVRSGLSPCLRQPRNNEISGKDRLSVLQQISEHRTIYFDAQTSRKIQSSVLNLEKRSRKEWQEMYNWRANTQLPIVKTHFFQTIEENLEEVKVKVFLQFCPQRLSDFSEIPLSQILYLIKESLIGFERLFSKIGGFEVNSSMIAINDNKKCKVWVNQDFSKNDPKRVLLEEENYISRIVDIYSAFVLRTSLSREFFEGFSHIKKFVKAFNYIDTFAIKNRILIPTRFMLEPRSTPSQPYLFRPLTVHHQQDKKSNGSNQKRSWNKSQKLSSKKKNGNEAHWLQFSHKAIQNNAMKHSNGTTEDNSTNGMIFSNSNSKQISSGYEDYEGEIQERTFISPSSNQVLRKNESMFRSEINQLAISRSDKKQKDRKFSSQYQGEEELKSLKASTQLQEIKEEKKLKLWDPSNREIASEQESSEEDKIVQQEIFKKNGWGTRINNLIEDQKQIKESVTIETESLAIGQGESSSKKLRSLDLLNHFGRHIGQSRLSHDFAQ